MNIVVTGASRGIGRAIALELASSNRNNNFLLTFNTNQSEVEKVRDNIWLSNNNPNIAQLDVSNRDRAKEVVEWFVKRCGNIDILINNAGITRDRTLKNMTDEEWDSVINTNLTGIYNMTKAVLPFMNKDGCIINITSIIGIVGGFGQVNYAASKAGVIGFTKSLAKEVAKNGIRINAIACGYVDTDMTKNIPEEYKKKIIESIPLKRFACPEEIARTVRFICLEGSYITGSVIVVDGGLT